MEFSEKGMQPQKLMEPGTWNFKWGRWKNRHFASISLSLQRLKILKSFQIHLQGIDHRLLPMAHAPAAQFGKLVPPKKASQDCQKLTPLKLTPLITLEVLNKGDFKSYQLNEDSESNDSKVLAMLYKFLDTSK